MSLASPESEATKNPYHGFTRDRDPSAPPQDDSRVYNSQVRGKPSGSLSNPAAGAPTLIDISPRRPYIKSIFIKVFITKDTKKQVIAMTLEEVRTSARQKLKGVCGVFKNCDGAYPKVCQGQSYGGPIGLGGAGAGAGFQANYTALERVRLKMRVIGPHFTPDTRIALFGKALSMPVLGASTAGVGSFGKAISEEEFCQAVVQGCKDAGTMGLRGDTFTYTLKNTPDLDAIADAGGHGVKIFKPRDQAVLLELIKKAEAVGVAAVGVDVDGCGSLNMAMHDQPVYRKSVDDLRELISATSLPFIVKGIMCTEDALAAVESGAAAVSVSNHGGRVLDHTPGVAEVLPGIAAAVKGKVTVLADGGIRSGYEVLKMLALGADAVLLGRDLIRAAVGAGPDGVRIHMEHMRSTLAKAMLMTGCPTVAEIGPEVLC